LSSHFHNAKPRRRRILVVHPDVGAILRLRHAVLAGAGSSGFELLAAANAAGGLRLFAARHPELILLGVSADDKGSPDEEALKLLSRVRAVEGDRHVGIIAVGSSGVACLEAGADDFLEADFDPSELRARVRAALRLKAMHDELRSANHRLRVLSLTDELTGLANMRNFGQKYGELMRRCRSGEVGFGILMLDLDHFKAVNDTTNHLIGSFVISEVGRLLRKTSGIFAEGDVAARYGGDEFIAAVVGSADEVVAKAERIRLLIAHHTFERDGIQVRITASIGVAWVPPLYRDAAEEAVKAADLMLYRSKAGGRDRVSAIRLAPEPEAAASLLSTAPTADRMHAEAVTMMMKKRFAS
jgi:diguanylate cyclase (GGDEF)-like protein